MLQESQTAVFVFNVNLSNVHLAVIFYFAYRKWSFLPKESVICTIEYLLLADP